MHGHEILTRLGHRHREGNGTTSNNPPWDEMTGRESVTASRVHAWSDHTACKYGNPPRTKVTSSVAAQSYGAWEIATLEMALSWSHLGTCPRPVPS
jgi:hypothetical protein